MLRVAARAAWGRCAALGSLRGCLGSLRGGDLADRLHEHRGRHRQRDVGARRQPHGPERLGGIDREGHERAGAEILGDDAFRNDPDRVGGAGIAAPERVRNGLDLVAQRADTMGHEQAVDDRADDRIRAAA